MDTSSPLAAMHRPAAPFGKRDLFANLHVRMSPGKRLNGTGSMSIRDQLNHEDNNYFGMKPIHGSSPAGSLAVDLCQNFSIGEDASPRFPTPRRALFTSGHGVHAQRKAFIKSPPVPVSSSPMPLDNDSLMQMTPVAKKTHFNVVDASSPLANSPTPSDDMILESPCPGAMDPARPFAAAIERKKPGMRRASLTRSKGFSFAAPSGRLHSDAQVPLFRFSDTRVSSSSSSSMSLSECFQESPPPTANSDDDDECRPPSAPSPCPHATAALSVLSALSARPRSSLLAAIGSTAAAAARSNGSPIHGHAHGHAHGHVRRTSSTFRPRRQYRRSISMFEDSAQAKQDEAATPVPTQTLQPSLLASAMDTDESATPKHTLPHFLPGDPTDNIPRIDRNTLLRVLDGEFNDAYDNKMVIDCRFEYEYAGGHINEAINFNDKDLLAGHLFSGPNAPAGRTLIVLHCEYSAHRAPLMARHIRAEDRATNIEQYPRLTYPELYILDGGYCGFFSEHPARCFPQAYVEMDAAEHAFACERELSRLRQNRKGLHRAQTFAFGQQERQDRRPVHHAVDPKPKQAYEFNEFSSPTPALGRPVPQCSPQMMLGASPILGCERSQNRRRMASY